MQKESSPSPLSSDPLVLDDGVSSWTPRRKAFHSAPVQEWRIHVQGNVVQVKRVLGIDLDRDVPDRGLCGPMSASSRMRMLKLLNRIDWKKVNYTLFVTLTYPDDSACHHYPDRAYQRQRFFTAVETFLGGKTSCIWRVEWKPRKTGLRKGEYMPHWHVLVIGCRWLPKRWVRATWRAILGGRKGPLATDVKLVRGHEGAIKYVAKYLSKQHALDIATYHNNPFQHGRAWGVTRKALLPMCTIDLDRPLDLIEIRACQLYAERVKARYAGKHGGGFTRLGKEEAEFMLDLFKCHLTSLKE